MTFFRMIAEDKAKVAQRILEILATSHLDWPEIEAIAQRALDDLKKLELAQ